MLKRVKKVLAVMMLSVMCMGAAITVQADDHSHSYSTVSTSCTNSTTVATHPYTDSTGALQTCSLVRFDYVDKKRCITCGYIGYFDRYELVHSACGQ